MIADVFGRSADFTVNVGAPQPPINGSDETLLKSTKIENIQKSLNKTTSVNLNVDGFMGESTRTALLTELVKEHLGTIVAHLNRAPSDLKCKSAVDAIRSKFDAGTVDESSVKANLNKLYSETEIKSKSSVKQDEPLVNYVSTCEILG